MSRETQEWLENNILVGFTEKRGNAWWYRGVSAEDGHPNHYVGPVPVDDVLTRLFAWEPIEVPLLAQFPDGTTETLPGRKGIARSDNRLVMGVFKDGYTPHGYREWLVENVATILNGSTGLGIGSAGLLRGGAQAWVQVELADNQSVAGVDFRPFILAFTSFDGSLATGYGRKIQAVVCDNTLAAARAEKGQSYTLKHTRYSGMRIENAREALAIISETAEQASAEIVRLVDWKVTTREWNFVLDATCSFDKDAKTTRAETLATAKREHLVNLWEHDDRVTPWQGTAFGVLQAFNTYNTHIRPVRGTNRVERNMDNVLSGVSEKEDAEILDLLTTICA